MDRAAAEAVPVVRADSVRVVDVRVEVAPAAVVVAVSEPSPWDSSIF